MERNQLLDIMGAVEKEEKERGSESKQEHEQLREEIRNKNLEDINVLRITLDGNIEELEQHFETAHLNYLQNTDQRTQDFKYLTAKDQDLSKDIEIKMRKIERQQSSHVHWRGKISQNNKECIERNTALQEEKDTISNHFQLLKSRMNTFRDTQSKRLKELAQDAKRFKGHMNENINHGTRILKLAELASKYETEQERVLPFYESTLEQDDDSGNDSGKDSGKKESAESCYLQHQPYALTHGGEVVEECNYLYNFHKRYNKVLLDEIAMGRETIRLENENQELQDILKQYLEGTSITAHSMDTPNPLFVINGRITLNHNTNMGGDNTTGKNIVVLDGNHIQNTYSMSSTIRHD